MKEYLTRTEFAAQCGLALETIKRYRTSGKVPEPDLYVDNKPLWKASTVQAWTEGRR